MVLRKITKEQKRNSRECWVLLTIVVLAGMVVCSGCTTTGGGRRSSADRSDTVDMNVLEQLQVAVDLRIDDIPVPVGFKLDLDDSFAFQNDYTRVGLLRYSGRAGVDEVVDFYQEQMPLYNWVLVNVIEYERSMLNFEKDKQSCIITCEGSRSRTVLTIATAPKSQKTLK
ncbi:MAG: hypothetical protein KAX15_04605 [Candidatus Omnitrophica bacterium]|nr:hypothetical protein [Candidatus Omnitrophota bacterium]